MLDIQKVKFFKILATVLGIVLIFLIGFGFGARGQSQSSPKTITKKSTTTKNSKTQDGSLTQNYVEDFLMVYYTKKDLGENRNRYKEYMTDAMYNQAVSLENEPTTQTSKGYVVDFEYRSSKIYLDTKENVALVSVTYTNTLLAKKNDYSQSQNTTNTATLRLSFSKMKNKFLVNRMESIILVDANNSNDYASVNTQKTSDDATPPSESNSETK